MEPLARCREVRCRSAGSRNGLTRTLRDRHTRYCHNENENHYRILGGPVRVAFAGKGGSGKTTLSSMFVRHLAAQGLPVVAIDADINQHLGEALGADGDPRSRIATAPRCSAPARRRPTRSSSPPAPRSSTSAPNWSTADPLPRGRQHLGTEPGDVLPDADRVTGPLSHHDEVPDPPPM